MAKREYKWRVTADRNGWERLNPVTDAIEATFSLPDNDATRQNLMLYGYKQALSDGAAADAGSRERDRMMRDRAAEIRNGTWAFRDGRTSAVRIPDATLFAAVVGAGIMLDTAANRKIWADAAPAIRMKFATDARVQQWLENNSAAASDASDTLAAMLQSGN